MKHVTLHVILIWFIITKLFLCPPSYLPGSEDILPRAIRPMENVTKSSIPSVPTQATSTCDCSASTNSPAESSAQPRLVVLKLTWGSHCKGKVEISNQLRATSPVCYGSDVDLKNVCKERIGCKGEPEWVRGTITDPGYHIHANGTIQKMSCVSLSVKCSGRCTRTNGMA